MIKPSSVCQTLAHGVILLGFLKFKMKQSFSSDDLALNNMIAVRQILSKVAAREIEVGVLQYDSGSKRPNFPEVPQRRIFYRSGH